VPIAASGLSAGAFAAVQFHVAFSDVFQGAAVVAGGPYLCSGGNEISALTSCMSPTIAFPPPQASSLVDETYLAEISGRISATSNLTNDNVYIYSGLLDSVVAQQVVKVTQQYYQAFVNSSMGGNIVTQFEVFSEHCFPTNGSWGEQCAQLGSPYIGQCNYDGAGVALQTLLGPSRMGGLNQPRGTFVADNLMQFDQTPFGGGSNSLSATGYIYVPTACQGGSRCRLHLSLHGCEQTQSDMGPAYATYTGLNEWAESNDIIVLYPYVDRSMLVPENPDGCWDWWGYTGSDFPYRTGPQMVFVMDVFAAIAGKSA
jgi:hypothetical protein